MEKVGQYAQAWQGCLDRQNQRQQAGSVACVFQCPVLLAMELHAGQLQRAVEPQRFVQAPGLGEALLEVDVGCVGQGAVQAVALPLQFQLLAVVVAPAGPASVRTAATPRSAASPRRYWPG